MMIDDILKYNQQFVQNKQYKFYETNKYPDKKLAIVTYIDTHLIQMLLVALGVKNRCTDY